MAMLILVILAIFIFLGLLSMCLQRRRAREEARALASLAVGRGGARGGVAMAASISSSSRSSTTSVGEQQQQEQPPRAPPTTNCIMHVLPPVEDIDIDLQAILDKCVPTVVYYVSQGVNDRESGGGACAVCLNAFEEGETLRLLPNCHHAFHRTCIDTWLLSSSSTAAAFTCPLCRCHTAALSLTPFSSSSSSSCSPPTALAADLQQRRPASCAASTHSTAAVQHAGASTVVDAAVAGPWPGS